MTEKTYQKHLNTLADIKKSGLSISEYYKQVANTSVSNFYKVVSKAKADTDSKTKKLREQFLAEYEALKTKKATTEVIDSDDHVEVAYIRDENNKIISYKYKIYKKNKPALDGTLTREEMAKIMRLYTWYGDGLTARIVSREFPQFSLPDLKRVFRAFAIFKDNAPFPKHYFEEYSEEELRDIQLREKENSFLRKAEEDNIRNNEKLLKKYAQENIQLKKQIETLSHITIDLDNFEDPYYCTYDGLDYDSALNIYLSDVHLGAAVETGALYDENKEYGYEEAKRRLEKILDELVNIGPFGTVNVCLLGDNLDCCGHAGYTASMTHQMPENMDPRDQFNKFIQLYDWFIRTIDQSGIAAEQINVYSVPTGNHAGSFEFALNNTLKYYTEARFPNVKFTLFDKFFGVFEQNSIPFILTHGKSDKFMRHGLPLNIDDKNKVKIYEWLDDNKLYRDNIHIIKGDLHSNNMNSCKRFTYRNVLSLFGSSDFSAYGFSRNSYGVSYDIIYGNNVLSGTIENV